MLNDRIAEAVLDPKVLARFWSKVNKSGECWKWVGAIFSADKPYGQFTIQGDVSVRAHRVSWSISNGRIPDGMHICHRCDNPPCVRPDHLFLGTDLDNVRDMIAKGRMRKAGGEGHPKARLNDVAVRAIRHMYRRGVTTERIAAAYGMSETAIRYAARGRNWRFVK